MNTKENVFSTCISQSSLSDVGGDSQMRRTEALVKTFEKEN